MKNVPEGEDIMTNPDQNFNYDDDFENFLKSAKKTRNILKYDIRKVYSQYPFCSNESQSTVSEKFVEEKYQTLKRKIKDKLREQYQSKKGPLNLDEFETDIINACVDELAKDFNEQLKIHKNDYPAF